MPPRTTKRSQQASSAAASSYSSSSNDARATTKPAKRSKQSSSKLALKASANGRLVLQIVSNWLLDNLVVAKEKREWKDFKMPRFHYSLSEEARRRNRVRAKNAAGMVVKMLISIIKAADLNGGNATHHPHHHHVAGIVDLFADSSPDYQLIIMESLEGLPPSLLSSQVEKIINSHKAIHPDDDDCLMLKLLRPLPPQAIAPYFTKLLAAVTSQRVKLGLSPFATRANARSFVKYASEGYPLTAEVMARWRSKKNSYAVYDLLMAVPADSLVPFIPELQGAFNPGNTPYSADLLVEVLSRVPDSPAVLEPVFDCLVRGLRNKFNQTRWRCPSTIAKLFTLLPVNGAQQYLSRIRKLIMDKEIGDYHAAKVFMAVLQLPIEDIAFCLQAIDYRADFSRTRSDYNYTNKIAIEALALLPVDSIGTHGKNIMDTLLKSLESPSAKLRSRNIGHLANLPASHILLFMPQIIGKLDHPDPDVKETIRRLMFTLPVEALRPHKAVIVEKLQIDGRAVRRLMRGG